MALDIYVWLTYRNSYLRRPTLVPWAALQAQFGAGYSDSAQGLRDFKKAFREALKKVVTIYQVQVDDQPRGLLMRPSRTHVAKLTNPTSGDKSGE